MNAMKHAQYVLVQDAVYANVEQSTLELFTALLTRAKPFACFERSSRSAWLNKHHKMLRTVRVLQFIVLFYRRKRSKGDTTLPTIRTNMCGHCLLKLRQGEYKIFDFRNQKVVTLFPDHIPVPVMEHKMNMSREAAKCKLAPRILHCSTRDRYMIETYVNLRRPAYDLSQRARLDADVFPVLCNIMNSAKPKAEKLGNYTRKLSARMYRFIDKVSAKREDKLLRELASFFFGHVHELERRSFQGEIWLVFSHGDFWEGNILLEHRACSVIDWSTLAYRSCFFDFFYFFFMAASKNGRFEKVDEAGLDRLAEVLEPHFRQFSKRVSEHSLFGVQDVLDLFVVYRRLFYLELIVLKLQAAEHLVVQHDSEVMTWIKRFHAFEKRM